MGHRNRVRVRIKASGVKGTSGSQLKTLLNQILNDLDSHESALSEVTSFSGKYRDLDGLPDLASLVELVNTKANKSSLFSGNYEKLSNKPTLYSYFPIWAEEGNDLDTDRFEWSFGNGNETPLGMGIVLPFDCELFARGLTHEGAATTEVEARINGLSAAKSVTTTISKKGYINFESDTVAYSAGDVMGFNTITGSIDSNGSLITAWFRKRI